MKIKVKRGRLFLHFAAIPSTLVCIFLASAVGAKTLDESITPYSGELDRIVTVHSIALLPLTDNLQGIYARPIENHLSKLLQSNHHWDLKSIDTIGPIVAPEDLERDPQRVAALSERLGTDAFVVMRVTKGPNGINMKLDLFLASDKKLYAQETLKNFPRFEVKHLNEQAELLLQKALSKLPYTGLVLSRHNNRVTLNIGKQDGVIEGQMVSAVQVIKLNRHPKFDFVINSEKEIIGKIRLLKIEDSLSFGKIVTEKESGAIQKDTKIAGIDFVAYPDDRMLSDAVQNEHSLESRPDGPISFGKDPSPWLPQKPPTFGQVGARLGLGYFAGSMTVPGDSYDAKDPYYMSANIEAELWITPKWTMHARLRQGIISTDNPRSGGDPGELSYSLSSHELLGGYRIRMGPSVWGPNVELLAGFASYRLAVDESQPPGLTTLKYTGFKAGVRGTYPIAEDHSWSLGSELFFLLNPQLSESPSSSGKSDNTINNFSVFVQRRVALNLRAVGSLDMELYSTKFSSGSANSSSRKHTTFSAGLYYLF
ncbi:MAG: hypothetical protein H6626_12140 [Pseudobdellovibrionaceae bacterium]|nr:hypothetical protein [Bdellovibrionales bacterium]USN46937.1 MAG: hypothetical protein H6626_12140 [Pseudobdellovibrionaceae bacterium]